MSLKLPRSWDFNLKTDAAKIARSHSVMSADPGSQPRSQPRSPRPLKLGWLRKQRSIVRNWQLRFFVLQGQQLLYYKDEDDAKPQGCLSLQGSTINVLATSPEEGGKFIFEIVPGLAGEQEPCVLMASSQAEREEWVTSLRRALGSAAAVFGQPLAAALAHEQQPGQPQVPVLVQKSAEFIREHGVAEEGIFRLPGQDSLVRRLRLAFDAGERPSFPRDTDVHSVASLFKLYLRELPEPVVPWLQYEDFLRCGQALEKDETKGHQELLQQLSLLPRDNYNLLSYICRFLYEIQLNSSVNKMSVDNLATVIGVNLIRPRVEDPAIIMRGTPQVQKVMTVLISDHEKLFPPSKDEPSPAAPEERKAPVPRSSVGWGAAEEPRAPRASPQRQMRDHPHSSSSPGPAATSSDPGEDTEPRDTQGTWKTQARKRTQTLPTRKSFLAAAPGERGDVLTSDFWTGSTRPVPSEGHKRTLSQDLFKLLDLHRASASDSGPSCQAGSGEGSPSPGSSISEKELLPCLSPSHRASSPAEEPSPEQQSRELLHSTVLRLEKDLEAQRKDYEGQIKSLQEENYEAWAKVVRLSQAMEQEKKKCGELELRLESAERSREELERKNKMLEEELKNLTKPTSETGAKTN
ncbi:rho GTPase-activating protein 25 isoform X2 [Oenanthe melanoleuca]|uniref:rho GTPase-activating protein 25 isoform X2 n=1 Tax=Oenanthe melanoleuca TaxID=2939378 RepID=UPI0024C1F84A|nr:rho GTPase-activating protein 25 isoform X2 [Oenanthe melanoleuca]